MFFCASEGSETRTISASSQLHAAQLDGKEACRRGWGLCAMPQGCVRVCVGSQLTLIRNAGAGPARLVNFCSLLKEERSAPCSSPYTTTHTAHPQHWHRAIRTAPRPAHSASTITAPNGPPTAAALARVSYRCSAREAETHSDTAGWPRRTHVRTAEGREEGREEGYRTPAARRTDQRLFTLNTDL